MRTSIVKYYTSEHFEVFLPPILSHQQEDFTSECFELDVQDMFVQLTLVTVQSDRELRSRSQISDNKNTYTV